MRDGDRHGRRPPAGGGAVYGAEVDLAGALFVHPSAQIHGRVRLAEGASVWPNAVIRAECNEVVVGPHSNVQDFVMIHVGYEHGTHVGEHSSLAHRCTVHGARIGDNCLVGIHAVVMDGCVIGDNSIVGAGAVLVEGTEVPPSSVVVGAPGKVVRTRNCWVANRLNAALYHRNAAAYARGDYRAWHGPDYEAYLAETRARLAARFAELFPGTG